MNYEVIWQHLHLNLSKNEELVQTPTGLWFKAYVKNQVLFVAAAEEKSPGCRISKPRLITKEDFMMVASYRDGWIHNIAAEKQKAREASQNTAYIIGLIMKYETDKGEDIQEKKIINRLDAVIVEFEILEKEYREIHSQAVDIDDIQESKIIQELTYEKIRKIKDWKKRVYHFSEEIEQHLYNDFSQPTNDVILSDQEIALSESRSVVLEVQAADGSDDQSAGEVAAAEAIETSSAMAVIIEDKAEDESDNGQRLRADTREMQDETDETEIIRVRAEVINSEEVDLISDENPVRSDAPPDYANESIVDKKRISNYVWEKLKALSQTDHIFSDDAIEQMNDIIWSKNVLGLNNELIRFHNSGYPVQLQINDELGTKRYWKRPFQFGEYSLLFTNQWFERNKDHFDNWYNGLNETNVEMDKPVAVSDVSIPGNDSGVEIISDNQEEISANILETILVTADDKQPVEILDAILEELPSKVSGKTLTESLAGSSDKPVSLDLFDSHEVVAGWDEVLFKVCRILLLPRPYSVAKLDQNALLNSNGVVNFSYIESEIAGTKERLPNGLWVSKANNHVATLNLCRVIFQLTGCSERDLIINYE